EGHLAEVLPRGELHERVLAGVDADAPLEHDEELLALFALADDDLPRLIAAHVGDVEDADELLVADEAEERDAVEDLELEVDLLRDLVDAAAALGHADDDRGDVVLAAPLVGERDEA